MEAHSFGYWLRLKRKALDLTREGLAGRVGCSAATIQKLEEEERRPSAQIVERLAEIFSIPQSERSAFLRFARGDLRSRTTGSTEASPWKTPVKIPRSNLPMAVTSLIGREKQTADIQNYLLKEDVRLVTLIGPPGVGKTRLSIEVAHTALPKFPDGVFFVALAMLDDADLIATAVAQTLGYVGARDISTMEQLKEGIGGKHILIVLDNCEHLIEDVASLTSALLSACSRLKILATSRESLRVPGEWLYSVQALEVPAENSSIDTETVSKFPALALFSERAHAVQPDFEITPDNINTVYAICKQLDGLPLAIELIAARTRLMPPQELLERLHDQFMLSADGIRAIPFRQKSLNNAIAWSYELLSNDEQRLFIFLSVFSGGFTLEAVEAVFLQSFQGRAISELITSLLDKSLLQRSFYSGGKPHYSMLVTIQEFARRRLGETGQEHQVRDWHLSYFLDLASQADYELHGPNQSEWLNRLGGIRDNLWVALDWASKSNQTEAAMQLAHKLWWFWSMRSEFNEGRRWLERVLKMPDVPLFSDLYADVLTQMAHHTCLQLGAREARPFIQQALSAAYLNGNSKILANALMVSGIVLTYEGNFATARSALEESITLFLETHDEWGYAVALMSFGYSAYRQHDHSTALVLSQQALAIFRELGDSYFQSVCLYEIGNLRAKQGDWEHGVAELRESLTLSRGLNSKYESAAGLLRLAETEQHLDRFARSVRLYCAAKNVYDSIGAWQQQDDSRLDDHLASCRAVLGEFEFAEAVAEGRAMKMEQAIDYALSITS